MIDSDIFNYDSYHICIYRVIQPMKFGKKITLNFIMHVEV